MEYSFPVDAVIGIFTIASNSGQDRCQATPVIPVESITLHMRACKLFPNGQEEKTFVLSLVGTTSVHYDREI